jgi:hypothetical protein
MTKAQEFDAQLNNGAIGAPGIRVWSCENREIIARALRRDEYIENLPLMLNPEARAHLAVFREAVK